MLEIYYLTKHTKYLLDKFPRIQQVRKAFSYRNFYCFPKQSILWVKSNSENTTIKFADFNKYNFQNWGKSWSFVRFSGAQQKGFVNLAVIGFTLQIKNCEFTGRGILAEIHKMQNLGFCKICSSNDTSTARIRTNQIIQTKFRVVSLMKRQLL